MDDEIQKRLREEARTRADFSKVHACVSSGDVPEEREARLLILGPDHPHTAKDANSPARCEAAAILESRGNSPRNYKNTLVFLAADANRLRELRQAARQFLAWSSIWEERETLNLDQFQTKQAETKRRTADETVEARIPETCQWLLVPGQPDPKGNVEWAEIRLQGQDRLAARAAKKLRNEELLMVQLGGTRLRHELDRVPLWRGDHVGIKQLVEDMARYLYLPRLRDEDVLLAAIRDGMERLTWQSETFAYAEGWDEARRRYKGLKAGQSTRVLVDGQSLLVKPEVAHQQMEAERQQEPRQDEAEKTKDKIDQDGQGGEGKDKREEVKDRKLTRFHGSVALDAIRLGRDAGQIAEEVLQHLTKIVGAEVQVTLEINAHLPDGAPDKLVRDVTENCRTLRFNTYGFEET